MRRKGGEYRQGYLYRSLFIILILLFCYHSGSAQYNPFNSIYEFDQRSGSKLSTDTLRIPNVLIEVHKETISTAPLSEAFPELNLQEDSISFRFPDLSNYSDTAALLWYLTNIDGSKPILSLMIIAMTKDTVLHYYIDYDHDAMYDDNANPLILGKDVASKEIVIHPKGSGKYTFGFANPTYSGIQTQETDSRKVEGKSTQKVAKDKAALDSAWIVSRTKPAIIIGGGLIIGPGKTVMEFDPMLDESVKHRKFTADIFSSGGLNFSAGVSYYGFKAGLNLFAEVLMYSGYREYSTNTDPNTGELRTNWRSHGNWPSTRFAYGGFLEYQFRLSQELRLSVFGSYSEYMILSDYYFLRVIDKSVGKTFVDTYLYSGGVKFNFVTGKNHLLYLSAYYQSSYFDASPYFNDIDPESYTMYFRQYCLSMGFDYRLGKK